MSHKLQKTNIGIKTFLFSIIIGISFIFGVPLKADDAALLPNAVQQFFDNNGNPLNSGKIYFYEVGTSTFKDVYTSSAATTVYANPITLNAAGRPPTVSGGNNGIYGIGLYRQVVKDRNNNTIWDSVTAPGGGSSTPTEVGDGNLVGTVLPWSGLTAPNQYVFAYGQEITRADFPEFFTAVTQSLNVICTSASNILTGISDTSQIRIGSPVDLSLCVAAGTTVVSKTSSSVTLSNPSSVSINTVARFFPWGNGDASTTFNVPDFRGYVMAGRTNMGGTASTNLSAYFSNTVSPNALGAPGGSQSITLTNAQVPVLTDPGHDHLTVLGGTFKGTSFTVDSPSATGGASLYNRIAANSSTTTTTSVSSSNISYGGGQAHSIVQPTITINFVVKVTPDTSTSIATGVYSIGGMTGVISCGTGLLCTGNIISTTGSTVSTGVTGNLAYYSSSTTVAGNANANMSNGALTLGVAASVQGQVKLAGSTLGTATITTQASNGSPTITLGTSSGTPAVTASTPLVITTSTGNITCPTCVTSSGGGAITGTAPVAVSAAGVVSITGAAGQVLAGASATFTATPTLGASGTLGSITFGNATSGLLTLQPIAGALGTVTVSIPTGTDTLVNLTSSQALTNKSYNGLTVTSSAGTLTIANNASAALITSGNFSTTLTSTATTNATLPAGTQTLAALTLASQTITGGANVTAQSQSTGNITIDCGTRPIQTITNNGAYTITAPANDGYCILKVTNGASAGATTFTGFSVGTNTGDPLNTTNTNKFMIFIYRAGSDSTYAIKALQ